MVQSKAPGMIGIFISSMGIYDEVPPFPRPASAT